MKNKLTDLNDHLFAQLERLGEEDLIGDALATEIERSKAVAGVGRTIIDNARLAFDAHKLQVEYSHAKLPPAPAMLGLEDKS